MAKELALEDLAGPALLAALGGALMLFGGGSGDLAPLLPGEMLSGPTSDTLTPAGPIYLGLGQSLSLTGVKALYRGPGRNTYTYGRIVQAGRTVYGSGVAGVFVGPSPTTPTLYPLVSPNQAEPAGCPPGGLCLYQRGTAATPICGWAPAQVGPAELWLEIYQLHDPAYDGPDGFASPTCGYPPVNRARTPVARSVYPVQFTPPVGPQAFAVEQGAEGYGSPGFMTAADYGSDLGSPGFMIARRSGAEMR